MFNNLHCKPFKNRAQAKSSLRGKQAPKENRDRWDAAWLHYTTSAWDQIPKLVSISIDDKDAKGKRTRRKLQYKKLAVRHFLPSLREKLPLLSGKAQLEAYDLVRVLNHWQNALGLPEPTLPDLSAIPEVFEPLQSAIPTPALLEPAPAALPPAPASSPPAPDDLQPPTAPIPTHPRSTEMVLENNTRVTPIPVDSVELRTNTTPTRTIIPDQPVLRRSRRVRNLPPLDILQNVEASGQGNGIEVVESDDASSEEFEFEMPDVDDFDPSSYYIYSDAKPRKLPPC